MTTPDAPEPEPTAPILLVDDRRENLLALQAILAPLGHRLVLAQSGEQALKHSLDEDFALILLDMRMPGMDGLETAAFLKSRERSRHEPIVFLTAFDDSDEALLKAYELGAADYIRKPLNPTIIRAKVAVFVELFLQGERIKAAERALALKAEALERSNRELERFAYVASHDLQEPLRMISSYTQLLARRYAGKLDQDADEFIQYAVDGARRMQRLIEDLLAYSRVTSKGRPAEPTSAGDAAARAVETLAGRLEDCGGKVELGELPMVMADPIQLEQVFQNLIGNALKFRGEAPPEVKVSVKRDGDFWRFSVKDNGIGMEAQYFDRVFVLFQRLHTRTEYEGTGIGLTICKRIVERLGGRIWIESQPGHGTTVYFTLLSTEAPRAALPHV